MSASSNPFLNFDMSQYAEAFKMPTLNAEAFAATQRKNLQALNDVTQVMVEGVRILTQRQAEIARQGYEEASKVAQELMAPGAADEKALRNTRIAKKAFEKNVSHLRELGEMVSKSQREALDLINERMAEGLDEIESLLNCCSGSAEASPKKAANKK